MKAKLEFELPMESTEHLLAVHGAGLYSAVWDFDQWLRGIVKHGEEKDQKLDAQAVRDKLWETLRSDSAVAALFD